MTTLTVVGSGTLVPNADRHSAAHWLRAGPVRLLVDCGPGTVHGLAAARLPWRTITHVAITHYHQDHVSDLAGLMYAFHHADAAPRAEPLALIGPPGFPRFLERLAAALGRRVVETAFPLDVEEAHSGRELRLGEGVALAAHPTGHTEEAVCYRIETRDGVVGYTGDTGPSPQVARFLGGSRVLVAECTHPDPPPDASHLSPAGLAALVDAAGAELTLVTHVAPPADPVGVARLVAERTGRACVAAADGMTVHLLRGQPVAVDPRGTPV